jgi:hypothetical protein
LPQQFEELVNLLSLFPRPLQVRSVHHLIQRQPLKEKFRKLFPIQAFHPNRFRMFRNRHRRRQVRPFQFQ